MYDRGAAADRICRVIPCPAPLSVEWGPPACLVHLGAHGCGRLGRTCTLEYSGGVAGGGGCDERHASGGTASRAGRALLIRGRVCSRQRA